MKFFIPLKDNFKEMDVSICRALLLLSFISILFYKTPDNNLVIAFTGLLLFLSALYTRFLIFKLRLKKNLLLAVAALLVFIATYSIAFPLFLLLFGLLTNFLYQAPLITIDETEVRIKKTLSDKAYDWQEFSNIILKENLLTIDFKNNHLLQLEIDEAAVTFDEEKLNIFCKQYLQPSD